MRIKLALQRYIFTPKLSLTLLTLCVLAFFIFLGCWQLHRADEKRTLQASYDARLKSRPLSVAQLNANQDLRYYPIKFNGYYDNAHNILLDNKTYNHQVGYEVLTPFLPISGNRWLLVNRGWIPAGTDRNQMPIIPAVNGEATIVGIIYIPLKKPFLLSHEQEKQVWPLRVQAIELDTFADKLAKPIYPFLIQLDPQAEHGFVRNWQPVAMPSYKHLGYALQWFLFAFVLLIIFIFLNLHKRS